MNTSSQMYTRQATCRYIYCSEWFDYCFKYLSSRQPSHLSVCENCCRLSIYQSTVEDKKSPDFSFERKKLLAVGITRNPYISRKVSILWKYLQFKKISLAMGNDHAGKRHCRCKYASARAKTMAPISKAYNHISKASSERSTSRKECHHEGASAGAPCRSTCFPMIFK